MIDVAHSPYLLLANYGNKLASVILKMIMISQVAGLARKLETDQDPDNTASGSRPRDAFKWDYRGFGDDAALSDGDEELDGQLRRRMMSVDASKDDGNIDGNNRSRNPLTRSLNASDRFRITELLGRWEEPQEERNLVSSIDSAPLATTWHCSNRLEGESLNSGNSPVQTDSCLHGLDVSLFRRVWLSEQ